MTDYDTNHNIRTRFRRRLQFNLLSLFALTTAACLALTWWVWPRPVDIILISTASPTPIQVSMGSRGGATFVDYQQEFLAALNSPQLLRDVIEVTGNGHLPMLAHRRDPAAWLRKRLRTEVQKNSSIAITLSVPKNFSANGVEVVDYMAMTAMVRAASRIRQRVRIYVEKLEQQRAMRKSALGSTAEKLCAFPQTGMGYSPASVELTAEIALQIVPLLQLENEILQVRAAGRNGVDFVQMATVSPTGQ